MEKPNPERLKAHLAKIARPRDPFENPAALAEIRDYIESELRAYGYAVEKHAFRFQKILRQNLIARKRDAEGPRFIIGAHFDAVPGTDGADDNASGMAGLLEAARILSASEAAAGIDFAAFDMEEYGISGSTAYVTHLKKEGRPFRGMISLEMIGYTSRQKGSQQLPLLLRPFYPDTGNFIALVGDGGSAALLKRAGKAFRQVAALPVETLTVPAKGWMLPETRLSDHAPFWDAGYPALLVTDTSFFRNPHYHTAEDRTETLDLDFMAKVTEGVIRLAGEF